MEKPLVDKKYMLEKYPGKGGWTYTVISEISPDKRARFGWVRVKGTIDNFAIKNYCLMPMSNGKLFLPVRAEIRKKTGKKEGDSVHVTLYEDNDPVEIPDEFLLCLQDEPEAHKAFLGYSEGQKKAFIDWIYSARTIKTKAERIGKTLDQLIKGLKFGEKQKI